jgi:hypothetical protein
MIMTIALLTVSGGLAAFMGNRLYVMALHKSIDVKGQRYARASDPFQFWSFVGLACFGLLFGSALFIASVAMLVEGI